MLLLNVIAFMIYDYRYRMYNTDHSSYYLNVISRYYLEILCYSFFSLEAIFGIIGMGAFMEPGSYLKDRWRLIYSLVLLISWSTYFPDNKIQEICMCIRLMGPIRILNLYEPLRLNLNSFLKALSAVYKIFLAIFALMYFYALVGMYLFYGLEENRCRITSTPENGHWEILEESFTLCGNWNCPMDQNAY